MALINNKYTVDNLEKLYCFVSMKMTHQNKSIGKIIGVISWRMLFVFNAFIVLQMYSMYSIENA